MHKPLFIARQGRRPSGLLGRLVARVMASETAPENARALDILDLSPGDRLLEVGCGHGRTLREAVQRAEDIRATGLDFSDVMLRAARRRNHTQITVGQVSLDHGDSARLPYGDNLFSAVLSVHTIYFWDPAEKHLTGLFRVLAPGGRLVLGYRPGDDSGFQADAPSEVYCGRSVAEVESLLLGCGFRGVHTTTERIGARLMGFTVAEKSGPW